MRPGNLTAAAVFLLIVRCYVRNVIARNDMPAVWVVGFASALIQFSRAESIGDKISPPRLRLALCEKAKQSAIANLL